MKAILHGQKIPVSGTIGAGVTSFNGRTGDVVPDKNDYTPDFIGALALEGGTLTGDLDMTGQKFTIGTNMTISKPAGKDYLEIKANKINFSTTVTDDEALMLNEQPLTGSGSGDLSAYALKNNPTFTGSISMYRQSGREVGDRSATFGYDCVASGSNSVAFGGKSEATGQNSAAFGTSVASGTCSFAAGSGTEASADGAMAVGVLGTSAEGVGSVAMGYNAIATEQYSCAIGDNVYASFYNQTVIGSFNKKSDSSADKFIIGKGDNEPNRANCFRVTKTQGVFASGEYNSSGADYAEMFEWQDGNPTREDRRGRFVSLDGDKIRLASPDDDFILGVISGNPSVVGDVYDDQWKDMYMTDVFGTPIVDKNGDQLININYNSEEKYIPRSLRPEWDTVGLLGKLVVIDDGSCFANGYVKVDENGIGTFSAERTKYRVLKRIDQNHVQILIL